VLLSICFLVSCEFDENNEQTETVQVEQSVSKIENNHRTDCSEYIETAPGYGVQIDWGKSGSEEAFLANSMSDLATIIIQGSDELDLIMRIDAYATIGGKLRTNLLSTDVEVSKNQEVQVPIDLEKSFDIHQEQYNYATTISCTIRILSSESKILSDYELSPRYLALKSNGKYEILDNESTVARYPHGILNEDHRREAQININDDEEDGILVGIGPRIYNNEEIFVNDEE
jgi:hypothetical protein